MPTRPPGRISSTSLPTILATAASASTARRRSSRRISTRSPPAACSLTNAYSCPTCAAARSTLYTGFNTGHANVDGNSEINQAFHADEVMTGTVLKQAGYNTAVFGKWGFGATGVRTLAGRPYRRSTIARSLPNNHGFDTFYGYSGPRRRSGLFLRLDVANATERPNGVATVANNGGARRHATVHARFDSPPIGAVHHRSRRRQLAVLHAGQLHDSALSISTRFRARPAGWAFMPAPRIRRGRSSKKNTPR